MNRGFGIGVPAMGPGAGFGANNGRVMQSRGRPSYAPGAVQSQSMMMPGQGEDVEELLAMLEAQSRGQNRPPAAMHAQPGPMPPQAPAPAQQFPASPVQAPKDRGMFGRFLGGLGKVAGKAGEFAMFGPVGMQIRADQRRGVEKEEQKTAEEEARRQQMLGQLGLSPQERALAQLFPEQAGEIIGQRFKPAAPIKGEAINDRLVNPYTGEVVGDYRDPTLPEYSYEQIGDEIVAVDKRDPNNRISMGKAPVKSPLVDINMPGDGPQETAFMKEAGALEAKNFGSLVEMGQTARRNRVTLDQLNVAAASIPGGLEASAKAALGNMGIETQGLSEIQATEALINQLVPAQRAPGSGPMSDRDLALFKQSLPRLIQSADGRAKILTNMKAINDYVVREGQIANRVLSGEITPQEGRSQIEGLGNPLNDNGKPDEGDIGSIMNKYLPR